LQERSATTTTYRWFADCNQNDPSATDPQGISVGTGLIQFDGGGDFTGATNTQVSIKSAHMPSLGDLEFELDFTHLSGLAAETPSLAVSHQDGAAPGTLTSFIIGDSGLISGVFSNGITRDLGQIRLVNFSNPTGLEQKGENMYAAGVNSGLPIPGNPSENGLGSIVAGATELSNTDVGGNLIELILASTMYRGNTRVITTVQQMFDELMALRR